MNHSASLIYMLIFRKCHENKCHHKYLNWLIRTKIQVFASNRPILPIRKALLTANFQ